MAAKEDTAAAAKAHTVSYIAELLSPAFATSKERATKMASYYLPTVISFVGGTITRISDPAVMIPAIVGVLDELDTSEGMYLEEDWHRIEVVGDRSAIVWIAFRRKGIVWTNVYFFRIMESGEVGWEGGNFDGEMWMRKQLAKK
jgi:hypothetical protein